MPDLIYLIDSLKHLSGIAAVGLSNATGEGNPCQDRSEQHLPTPRLTKGKVVAKFNNGVRMGMGFLFERSIDGSYNGQISEEVRVFRLRPHYEVKLRRSKNQVGSKCMVHLIPSPTFLNIGLLCWVQISLHSLCYFTSLRRTDQRNARTQRQRRCIQYFPFVTQSFYPFLVVVGPFQEPSVLTNPSRSAFSMRETPVT